MKLTPKINLTIQTIIQPIPKDLPKSLWFKNWIKAVLNYPAIAKSPELVEITIRIVDSKESAELNEQYRKNNGPTNILSFNYDSELLPKQKKSFLCGDLVICLPIVKKEALEQKKSLSDHLAHLTVHGMLHLLGYDHIKDEEAEIMEELEDKILNH